MNFGSTFAEPFTPRGVAAFARGKFSRLLLAQFMVALLAAVSLTLSLNENCFSVVQTAIQNLPDAGKISNGQLDWRGDSPKMLAEGKLLAIDVDLDHGGAIHSTADVQVEFGKDSVRIYSLLGYSEFFYPPHWPAPFNRTDLQPLWGAWAMEIIFISAAAIFIALLSSWTVLATIYFLPVWLLGFFANRELNLHQSWKLSAAALLPGALLMIFGIWLYDFGVLNLVSFLFVFAAHFLAGWIYLAASFFFLPRISADAPKKNPFSSRK
jgi:hypothetical protein